MDNVLSLLRKYRAPIMGLAIVWVMCNHSGISGELPMPFRFLAEAGYGGVDIFLLLSGFGLYYSLERDPREVPFYRRRAEKIFPAYIPVLLVWAVKTTGSGAGLHYWLRLLSGNLTGASFWLGTKTFNWYILALPVFYFAAPFLKRQLDSGGKRRCGELILGALFLSIAFWDEFRLVAVSRFPIFMVGMYLAKMERGQESPKEGADYLLMILGFGALYFCLYRLRAWLWDYGLWWYPFLLITPGLVMLLCRIGAWMEKTWIGRRIGWLFRHLGEASLEIYLIHVPIFEYLEEKLQMTLLQRVGVMAACAAMGIVYHRVIEAGKKSFQKTKQKTI